ncbi:hypothetical protein Tco_1385811 [Tanacetum coccineum]
MTSSKFSPKPSREPTPPRDSFKGLGVAIEEKQGKELVMYMEEGGSNLKMPKLKTFITQREPYLKWTLWLSLRKSRDEAKKAKLIDEYTQQISFRADLLPITKISYVINSHKEATMKITRGDNHLNLVVYLNFLLKMLGFSEWLEVHALAAKKFGKSNDMLLQSLRSKFQWVLNQDKKIGLLPPPALATFGMTVEERKRKRIEMIKHVFVKEDVVVDETQRNVAPPPGVVGKKGLMDIARDSLEAEEVMGLEIESRHDVEQAREIIMKGLSECKASESNVKRIEVKDIVKVSCPAKFACKVNILLRVCLAKVTVVGTGDEAVDGDGDGDYEKRLFL